MSTVVKRANLTECLSVSWPLILAMAGNALMMFVDRMFLSRYSEVSIQAAMPAGLTAFMVACFFQSVVSYSGTFVAQYHGAGARAACARVMGQGLWLSLFCLPFLLLSIPLGNWIFDCAGHAPDVVAEEKIYYLTLMMGNLALPFIAVVSGFFSGQGYTTLVMVANLIGNGLNIALDPIFIWGYLGVPELGIFGAALATALSQVVILAILSGALLFEKHFATRQRRRVAFVWKPLLAGRILRFGMPSGIHVLLDVSTFTVFTFITGRMDALSFSASNIGFSINHLIFAPLLGIGMGATILTGQRMGDKDLSGAVRACRNSLFLGYCYIALCLVAIGGMSEVLLDLFYPSDATFAHADYIALGKKLIAIFLAWACFDTLNIVLGGALKGAGDTRFVMFWMVGCAVLLWVPSFLILFACGASIVTLWLTMLGYCGVAGLGLLVRFLCGRWKQIRMIE